MSNFIETIDENSSISHLDDHFGWHIYGFEPLYRETNASNETEMVSGGIYRHRKEALKWLKKRKERADSKKKKRL